MEEPYEQSVFNITFDISQWESLFRMIRHGVDGSWKAGQVKPTLELQGSCIRCLPLPLSIRGMQT